MGAVHFLPSFEGALAEIPETAEIPRPEARAES